MKRNTLFLISIVSILITSCNFQFDTAPTYKEEWGCMSNTDGTDFEWVMPGNTTAVFTQDSQKIVYRKFEGIYTRDYIGNEEKISDLSYYDYTLLSPDLQYVLHEDKNDIYRMDIDGSNRINLTNTPESREYDSYITYDGDWITFVTEADTVYSIMLMDINGENNTVVLVDSFDVFYRPKLNIQNNCVYYIYQQFGIKSLNHVSLENSIIILITDEYSCGYEISGFGNKVAFGTYDYENLSDLHIYDTLTNQTQVIHNRCHSFSIDYYGTKLIHAGDYSGSDTLVLVDIENNIVDDMPNGESCKLPSISPDGEKIFFIKDRVYE